MAKLKMLEEEGNKLVKIAHTMVAKDGEVRKKLFLGVTLIFSLVGSFLLCNINIHFLAGSVCEPLLPHRASGGLVEQADGGDEGDHQVSRSCSKQTTKFYYILSLTKKSSSQSLFCCLCEDLPEHTKGGVATALPSPGKPDISRIFATLCHRLLWPALRSFGRRR